MFRASFRSSRLEPQAGFTLLEVLTAFLVMALTLAVLLQVFAGGLRDAQLAEEYARATVLAESRLAGFGATDKLEEGDWNGTDGPFRWTLTSSPYDERAEAPGLQGQGEFPLRARLLKVESTVAWQAADGRLRDVRLVTLRLAGKP